MPEVVTYQGEDKELGDALDGEFLVSVAHREEPALHPGETHAEGAGRRRGEGGNVIGDGPLVEMAIALVARGDDGLHVSVGRERPGRYSFGRSVVIPEGIVVHAHPLLASVPTSLQRPPVCPPVPSRLITPGSDVPGPKVHPAV